MKPYKVKDLYQMVLHEIEKGNGDKVIMLSNDDEGNGYHYMWYAFNTLDESWVTKEEINENIAKYEDTIILG